MDRLFIPGIEPPDDADREPAWWFVFRGAELLIVEKGAADGLIPVAVDLAAFAREPVRRHYLGLLHGRHSYAVEIADIAAIPSGYAWRGLRGVYGLVPDDLFAVAGRAAQIVEWDRTHQFCGRCGMATEYAPGERAKRCPRCGLLSFPRLSPAIIVLVERGDEVLLAHGRGFAAGVYSTLAGFVEPGESLEEAVRREIFEEVSVELEDIQYFGSQPWPFPHSLMIGFTAKHARGEIAIDGREIEDARWFTVETLPKLPMKISIARRLIDSYVAKHGPPVDQP